MAAQLVNTPCQRSPVGGAARCKWDPPIGLSADCDTLKVSASQSGCWLGWATSSPEGSLS